MQAGPTPQTHVVDVLTRLRARRPVYGDLLSAWRRAERHAGLALAGWREAPDAHKREAHAVYAAALDQEAQAAEMLRLAFA
jgi:hypothetical protein